MTAQVYLGEKARIAVACLNASWDGPPIVPDGDGWWLAPRTPTQWDAGLGAPTHLRWSDAQVIAQAEDMGALLVVPRDIADQREVR